MMKKIFKKVLISFMVVAVVAGSIGCFGINSNAASVQYVSTEDELTQALCNHENNEDHIILTNDIEVQGDLYISWGVNLDLQGYSIQFNNSIYGLICNTNADQSLCIRNGNIYGAEDSNSAIYVMAGNLGMVDVQVFGGDNQNFRFWAHGHALCCTAKGSTMFFNGVELRGGNGYACADSRRGHALYIRDNSSKIYALGNGYRLIDGIPYVSLYI